MAALGALVALGVGAGPARADAGSLFSAGGTRPGPARLYDGVARAPQLTNAAPFRARPILVSGATAYRSGEFLYQDFLYDDHGAQAKRDPGDPRAGGDLFSPPNGTYTYPTDPLYAGNAADLVELRVRPTADATLFRLTLNSLQDAERVGATVALGSSPTPRPMPYGANTSAPAERFLTWHGGQADLRDAATGAVISPEVGVSVDRERRQVTLSVPRAAYDPGQGTVRMAAGVGLWDRGADRYLIPGERAGAAQAGGAGGLARPSAFYNVAFRSAEPTPALDTTALTDPVWWRDRAQGHALRDGDLSSLSVEVDFGKLARGTTDDGGVPRYGALNRILASHVETKQGTDFSTRCQGATTCPGQLRGRLQPYAIYVPRPPAGSGRYALTLLLHSLTANYNQFTASRNQRQFAERGQKSIVITPEGRGPDGFYRDHAGADTFEVWADVAARYRLDPRRTSVAGYSMGGFGTFRFAAQYPDLFARAQPTVGALDIPATQLASTRWVPFLMWNAQADELVPPASFRPAAERLQELGYRVELDVFAPLTVQLPVPTQQHLALAVNDQFAPAARFLDAGRVVRDPARVTFAANPATDYPGVRTVADHAYWLSRVRVRAPGAGLGTVDVVSRGFGQGSPRASGVRRGSGTLTGGALGPRPFAVERQTWSRTPRAARGDVLDVRASNVRSLTIDPRRARVTCGATVQVVSDGPLTVRLAACPARR